VARWRSTAAFLAAAAACCRSVRLGSRNVFPYGW
jgi:hypothetical protein